MTKSTSEPKRDAPFVGELARTDVRLTADRTPLGGIAPAPAGDPQAEVSDLAARVAASIAPKPLPAPTPGGFGVMQRWTLTRLGFTPRIAEAPRALIVRTTFIAGADLAGWRDALPPDAHPLPPGADAIVDGLTAEDTTAFYAVLEATPTADASEPARWQSLPLMPLSPPFETAHSPFVLGPARTRIEAFARTAPASPELAALIAAALRGLA